VSAAWLLDRVVWSGDRQTKVFAEMVSSAPAVRLRRDVRGGIIDAKATLHVTARAGTGTCSTAVPHDLQPHAITGVVGAVGGGPHSPLAAAVTARLSERLGVPGQLVTGYRSPERRPAALQVLGELAGHARDLPMRALPTERPPELVASLPEGTLLVIGAPGGTWFQRQLYGPGVRLRAAAPAGAIVVRAEPCRVFQVMRPAQALGPQMRTRDALELGTGSTILVAEYGRLVGVVDRKRLLASAGHTPIGDLVDMPVALAPDELLDDVAVVTHEHDGAPLGVVDDEGALIGVISSRDIHRGGYCDHRMAVS
jgi:CBS domain-containing protein